MTTTLNCIGVLAHPLRPQTHPVAARVAQSLAGRGITTWMHAEWQDADVAADGNDHLRAPASVRLIMSRCWASTWGSLVS